MASESYIAMATVDDEERRYSGAARLANGGAEERRVRIASGISGAYLRPKGLPSPSSAVTLETTTPHASFQAACVDEVVSVLFGRIRGERIRGGPYSNVKLNSAQKKELLVLEKAVKGKSRADAAEAVLGFCAVQGFERLRKHCFDLCFICGDPSHYEKASRSGAEGTAPAGLALRSSRRLGLSSLHAY